MGMFSFLTGKKDDDAGRRRPSPATPTARPPAEPSRRRAGATADAPFAVHAAEAWNIDALTAPRRRGGRDTPQVGPVDPAQTAELQRQIIEVIKTVSTRRFRSTSTSSG